MYQVYVKTLETIVPYGCRYVWKPLLNDKKNPYSFENSQDAEIFIGFFYPGISGDYIEVRQVGKLS